MSLFGNRESGTGTWFIESESDPRWNASGPAFGMWDALARANEAVVEKRPTLGEPPKDLMNGWNKR